ncbi:hypothetical protein D3C81_2001620 [compost metagenome]
MGLRLRAELHVFQPQLGGFDPPADQRDIGAHSFHKAVLRSADHHLRRGFFNGPRFPALCRTDNRQRVTLNQNRRIS